MASSRESRFWGLHTTVALLHLGEGYASSNNKTMSLDRVVTYPTRELVRELRAPNDVKIGHVHGLVLPIHDIYLHMQKNWDSTIIRLLVDYDSKLITQEQATKWITQERPSRTILSVATQQARQQPKKHILVKHYFISPRQQSTFIHKHAAWPTTSENGIVAAPNGVHHTGECLNLADSLFDNKPNRLGGASCNKAAINLTAK